MKKWDKEKTFEKSISERSENKSYVFYDGPPFATGLPHYGHIVAGTMKDLVPRFWTMKGHRVERRWGWDCHGLPIENIVEKEMKLNSRKDIEDLGVDKFNETCRSKVLTYADDWKKIVKRLGRWVDMENDYKTMDVDFMESVWWVFKSLWDKDLVYEGRKSMHVCPRCETTLSNMEVGMGYQDTKDISVTAKFELVDEPGTYILAWTTTPWTLPGNVALAIGEKLNYVKFSIKGSEKFADGMFVVAREFYERFVHSESGKVELAAGVEIKIVEEFKGKALEGKKYKPLFDYYAKTDLDNKENFYQIVTADFVEVEEGTGVVHIAPAFGENDMAIGEEKDLPFVQHVTLAGRFTKEVTDFVDVEVKPKEDPTATDVLILKNLAAKGLLFEKMKYEHSYPFCWRCDSPLLNYSTSSWFVKVTKIKNQMLKQAKKVSWVPRHLKEGRFGQWLEGARDWSVSRSRYWGNPMPVWRCECGEIMVVGGREELEKLSGEKVTDLHKHFVDKIEIPCEKCDQKMKRIPEVLDCWFESGSMPYGQMHYPFENKEKFETNFPAEFIAEGVDQCRAWFYTLHVLGTALFDKPAYKNVVVNGIVLAEDGKKMSKKDQNYPDPMLLVDKYGADALRFYLINSSVMRAEDLKFSEKGVDEVYKKIILITQNVLSFYSMFNHVEPAEVKSEHVLDKWILAKLNLMVKQVDELMTAYELTKATKPIAEFINELSTWYVRRSRARFKDEQTAPAAVATLREVLEKLSLIMAPFMPFMSEHLWLTLGNEGSVHLQLWPEASKKAIDEKLMKSMVQAREVVELGLSARDEAGIKVRQPLQYVRYEAKKLDPELENIIAEEINVKEVKQTDKLKAQDGRVVKENGELKVGLNIELTEELQLEGLVRELTRKVNNLRKEKGLTIHDTAKLVYNTDGKMLIKMFASEELVEKLKQATLLSEISQGKAGSEVKVNEETIQIDLQF